MSKQIEIQIVSDVVCPWCVIGKGNLKLAIDELTAQGFEVAIKQSWLPFQLNPNMPPEGESINEHLIHKYGLDESQLAANKQRLVDAGRFIGFTFNFDARSRIYNTFNAHLLIQWAKLFQLDSALNQALFTAYFSDGVDISQKDELLKLCTQVGLDAGLANEVLKNKDSQAMLTAQLQQIQQWGIQSVPTFIINNKYAISGGQPPEVFKQAIEQVAKESI